MKQRHLFLWNCPKNSSSLTVKALVACLVLGSMVTVPAFSQDTPSYVFHPNQEVHVANLPALTAISANKSAVLAAALGTIPSRIKPVCCGKNSALEDTVLSPPPSSKDHIGAKLQGKHVLSDGRSVMVSAEFVPQSSITSDLMISALRSRTRCLSSGVRISMCSTVRSSMKRSLPTDSVNLSFANSFCWIHDSLISEGKSNSTAKATIGRKWRDF